MGHAYNATMAVDNQLKMVCPIFKVETKISQCFQLREKVWRGEVIEKRQGCQACMNASKCPIVPTMRRMVRAGIDPYFSPTEQVGTWDQLELDNIARTKVLEMHTKKFTLSPMEQQRIDEANEDAAAGVVQKGRSGSSPKRTLRKAATKPVEVAVEPVPVAIIGGDYADAINSVMTKGTDND